MWRRPACSLRNLISQFQIAGQMYSERSDYSIPTHSVRIFLQAPCFPGSVRDLFRTPQWRAQTAVHAVFRYFVFDPLDISWFWSRCYNMLYANMLHAGMKLSAPAKTPFRCYLLALF